jgi:hypothetical protein
MAQFLHGMLTKKQTPPSLHMKGIGTASVLSGWLGSRPCGYFWSVVLIRSLDVDLTPLINVDLDDVRVDVDSMSRINALARAN